jgi:hypothetical protein
MRSQADTMLNMTSQPSGLDISENGPSFSMLSGVSDVDVSTIPLPQTKGISHKTSQILASLNVNTTNRSILESPSKSLARNHNKMGEDQKTSDESWGGPSGNSTAHQAGWYQRGYWKTKYQKF